MSKGDPKSVKPKFESISRNVNNDIHISRVRTCIEFKVPSRLCLEWNNEFLTCSTPLNVVYHCPHLFRWAYFCPSLRTMQQRTIIFLTNIAAALRCWRLFHKFSQNAIIHAIDNPPISTTNTPPTLLSPKAAAPLSWTSWKRKGKRNIN